MKLYLTKQERTNSINSDTLSGNRLWNYITDPANPTSVQTMGIVDNVEDIEIRVDMWGSYVEREFSNN